MAGKRFSRNANFICDRSGGKYKMSEAVIEPGTGYLVHRRFSDGMWNMVDHPANHIERYAKFGDPFPIENARPERDWSVNIFLADEYGNPLVTEAGENLEYK